MLRAIFLYLSKARWARRMITGWGFSRRAAARFVAGDHLEDAIQSVRRLNEGGLNASLDHLGESVTNAVEASRAVDEYIVLMDKMCETGLHAYASLKLSQLGLGLDFQLCLDNFRRVVRKAAKCGLFIRIDMEDSSTVDRAFQIFDAVRKEGLKNVGVVIQSYLFRSEADVRALTQKGASIRLCKGAYKEPASVAFPRKADVDASYDRLARIMIDASLAAGAIPISPDGKIPPLVGIATHDENRIAAARAHADQVGFPKPALEFQMLYGIRSELQRELAAAGYPVRVYVPYGTEWYPYYMRRLAERPANIWFFLSNFFRR